MTYVTVLTGIDVLGDGYDSVYVGDKLIVSSDGSGSYSDGAADALVNYLTSELHDQEAEHKVVHLEVGTRTDDEASNWWYDLDASSLAHVIESAAAFGLEVRK